MQADAQPGADLYQAAAQRAAKLGRAVLVSATRATNTTDPIALFARASDVYSRSLWLRPSSGEALVGLGSAHSLIGSGKARFRHIAAQWRDLLDDAVLDGSPYGPRLVGGFSYDPRRESTSLWAGFPDARMVLPRDLLTVQQGAAWLTTSTVFDPRRLDNPHAHPAHQQTPGLSTEVWKTLVASLASGILDRTLGAQKVVLALAHATRPTRSIEAALRTLASDYPSCTIFAIAQGDACFLGATPERLIALHQGRATTEALAGSAPRGATPREDRQLAERFLSDNKERIEHALVVAALRDAMSHVCTRVVVDAERRLRKLPNLQHFVTSIRGQVADGQCVLDLVERLHPTPAVGGFPRTRAEAVIRERESLDRGWYAGPIGWMDADGDGEFVVGIRSGLVRGNSATLFAGCGIVAGSDPDREYAEWGWKLQPMLAALGAT